MLGEGNDITEVHSGLWVGRIGRQLRPRLRAGLSVLEGDQHEPRPVARRRIGIDLTIPATAGIQYAAFEIAAG